MIYFISAQQRITSSFTSATMADVIEFCHSTLDIGVDTETTGFDYIDGKIIMLQIGNFEHQYVIDVRNIDIMPLGEILNSKVRKKYLQNVKFDYKFFRKHGIILENVVDIMLQEQILVNGKQWGSFGLADLVSKYCYHFLDKSFRSEFSRQGITEFSDSQIIYGANDVKYLIPISNAQILESNRLNLNMIFKLENAAALAIADISYNGININPDSWMKIAGIAKEKADAIACELDTLLLSDSNLKKKYQLQAVQQDMFLSYESLRQVNTKWSSPLQVLNIMKNLVPNLESVNSELITPYRYTHPLIDMYIKYKELTKKASSYGEAFLDNRMSDGKIHTEFNQILITGRLSSSKPNMQQIPADNLYRNCFETGDPDWVFVSADYVSQELALIAHASGDPVWLKALQQGQDLHSVCAELVFGNEWKRTAEENCLYFKDNLKFKCECKRHKKLRQSVKEINFGLSYGMTEVKLAFKLQIPEKKAAKLIKDYFKIFPRIKEYLDSNGYFGTQKGYIRTLSPWGRIRWFPEWKPEHMEWSTKGSIERESKNTPIQGAGADMVKYALVGIRHYINNNNIPVKIVMQVHDQIDTICHKDFASQWSIQLKELMEDSAKRTIPSGLLKAAINISLVWEK